MKKLVNQIGNAKKKINSIYFDAHWYRRVFHTFGASFLVYYALPDIEWVNSLKFWIPLLLVIAVVSLELLRIRGKIDSKYFFGLRMYEKNRAGSYVFFAVGILLIFLLRFPQQIAIPCILCACIADPVIGEVRNRLGMKHVYWIGFLFCMFLFMVTWYRADLWVILIISILGALGAIIGETKKFWWLDDDFMIQVLPAVIILIVWLGFRYYGLDILPSEVIQPVIMLW